MMTKITELLEFVCDFASSQIDKYPRIAWGGVGPDSLEIACLIARGVDQLFNIMQELTQMAGQEASGEIKVDNARLSPYVNQMRFYVEQEFLVADAALRVDADKAHVRVFDIVKKHKEQIDRIAKKVGLSTQNPAQPANDQEKQYQHDSNEAAFSILKLAKDFKENPEIKVEKGGRKDHATMLLQKYAAPGGRFHDPAIWNPIMELYGKVNNNLTCSQLERSRETLSGQDAKSRRAQDESRLESFRTGLALKASGSSSYRFALKTGIALFSMGVGVAATLALPHVRKSLSL